jgi:hypothetical protein
MDPLSTRAIVAWCFMHLLAILVAWGTRLATGTRCEALSQLGFLAAMLGVAATACWCCQLALGYSVPSGMTLVGMVLLAVVDLRPTQEQVGRLHC